MKISVILQYFLTHKYDKDPSGKPFKPEYKD